ncbi:hypothetical protein WOLCODRAFT_67316, partial [Wolfiporia cocos MD-104 SS10]
WISTCVQMKIKITAQQAQLALNDYRARFSDQHQAELNGNSGPAGRKPFSNEAFLDAICDWVVADDQAINAIECAELRAIFLMLREDLRDTDIPHRTTVRERVCAMWAEHLTNLEKELKHLAIAFTHILDRIGISSQLGWITLDNASNNGTFMRCLEAELKLHGIAFDHMQRRIRYAM